MSLELLLPRLSAAIEEGTLERWHKQVGDDIAYGDDLCDIVVQEVTRLRRRLSARLAAGKRERTDKAKYRKLEGVAVRFRIVSAEVGKMSEIVASPGMVVREGDLLGLVGAPSPSEKASNTPKEHTAQPPLGTARVVVNHVTSMEE